MPSPMEKAKKRRTSAPKNRTGCGTCKRRHKRCDETVPICDLCSKSGYVCDGYFDPSTGRKFGGNARSMRHFSQCLRPVSLDHFGNEKEAQGFRFFEIATTLQLTAALKNLDWTPPLLQLSHHDRAIRHAIIANGIMSKRYQENELAATANPQADTLYQEALQQYGKAIACLRSQIQDSQRSSQLLEKLPAICVLLVMFEFVQGNAEGLLLHLQSANKLASKASNGPQAQNFLKLLTLIDMVTSTWVSLYRSHSHTTLQLPKISANQMPLPLPSDLITLSYDLVNIKNDLMTLRHSMESALGVAGIHILNSGNLFEANLDGIMYRLEVWYLAFVSISGTNAISSFYRCTLLRANYLLAMLELDVIRKAQSAWDTDCDDSSKKSAKLKLNIRICSEIVDLTEAVIKKGYTSMRYDVCAGEESLAPTGLVPLFSFRLSFIQPVFYVTQNAPDIGLRRRAIRILLQNPWREGAWDSFVMGSIAQRWLDASIKGLGDRRSTSLSTELGCEGSGVRFAFCP